MRAMNTPRFVCRVLICWAALAAALGSVLRAAEADPAKLGFDPARLGRLDALINEQV
ncbi:MAG: hypothetical protein RLZZ15_2379, partial [Verrucomicrobiota bacterium]